MQETEEIEKIKFPKQIKNNFTTIQFLNGLLDDTNKDLYYSMEEIKFFDASLVPFFHSINKQLFKTHAAIYYDKIQEEIEKFFLKNKYAKKFNKKYLNLELKDEHNTYIDFTTMQKEDDESFYIIKENIKTKNLIDFNDELQSSFLSLIGELTNNSYEHGQTDVAYFCGQYFPRISRLSFSISNLGNTIIENVKSKYNNYTNEECLEWIFELGTTTREDDTSGGQGLYRLREVVFKLRGNITIISGNDYYHIDENQETTYKLLENKYEGTTFIINIYYNRGEN